MLKIVRYNWYAPCFKIQLISIIRAALYVVFTLWRKMLEQREEFVLSRGFLYKVKDCVCKCLMIADFPT